MTNFVDGSLNEQSEFPKINPNHLKEWNSSRVDPEITRLNVISVSGYLVYDYLTYGLPNSERRNDGRLRDRYIFRYAHAEAGMFWCNGIDILTGEPSNWGQGKADTPYSYQEKTKGFDPHAPGKIKTIKYETPPKVPTEAFFLRVPRHIWQAIGERYNVPLPEDIVIDQDGRALGFWAWVVANPKIHIIITEGAKKAGALLSAGYCGVALPGVNNGYRQPKNEWQQPVGSPYLIPQLAAIAQEGREIDFCFDHDTKPQTIKNVRTAISKTGYLFQNAGCQVKVITWNYPEKGVDDLIAARGVDCFHQFYRQRTSLGKFKLTALLDLTAYNPLKLHAEKLDEKLVPPADANLIGIKSAKSTGKTTWLKVIVQEARDNQQRVIVLTHREQLSRLLAQEFDLDYRTEVRTSEVQGALGYTLVIDSLHPNANPPFDPNEWQGAVVIIDEVEQALWHLLDSTTCRYQRVKIISSFRQLLQTVLATGGKVYVADADLSPISLDYIRDLVGFPVKPWIVENTYLPNQGKRTAHIYTGNDPREMVAQIFSAVESEQKILLHVSAQKMKSQWGSINLESSLAQTFPNHRILRIDSESVANPNHPAYGCIDKLDSIIANYDIVIATPVLETGVSIEIKHHFDSVWAIAQGVQSVDAVCQTIERLRDDVPRHLWIKTTAKGNRVGNGETSIKGLLRSQHKLARANMSLLQQADVDEFDEFDPNFSPTSLTTWAKRACVVNMGKNNYRQEIVDKLAQEGYKIEWHKITDEVNGFSADVIKEHIQETKTNNYNHHCEDIAATESPTSKELEVLNSKRAKTSVEQLKERKGNLERLYGVEVDAELVKQDDQGWYPQLLLYYYLTVGNKYLDQRDRKTLRKLDDGGENKGFAPDVNQSLLSAKIEALKLLEIEQFLDPTNEFTNDSLGSWWEMMLANRRDIQIILGVGIGTSKDTPIAAAQRLLKKLGLKLNFLGQYRLEGERDSSGIGHKRIRVYQGCNL
ncbi:MAG: plasmid replication protein, CyRepA1 family, partial [Waterburya sp.]